MQNTCGGTVVAIPGTSKLTFADGSIDAGTMCTMTARVMSIASGPSTVALQVTSPAGSSNLAQATLNVSLPPRLDQTFSFAQAPPGVTVATTLTFTNLNRLPLTPVALVETLPQDLNIASPNGLTSTCGGTVTATPGTNTISLGSGVLPPGTCSITLNVSSSKVGTYSTTVAVITPAGWSNAATASLIVAEGLRALDLTQTFSKAKLPVGGVVSLALLLTNPNPGPIPGVAITTALPPGLAVATPNCLVNTCAGPVAAIPGTRSVTLANGTVPGAGSCQISLSVQAMAPGEQISTTGPSVGAASTTFAPPTVKSSTFVMSPPGSYQVRYAANLPFGDSIMMLSNTGVSFTGSTDVNDGSLCVSVYAYSSTEQLVSCCSCLVTGSGLNLLSAQKDLVPNTLSLQSTPALVVKLLASAPQSGACNPALVTYDKLKPGLAAWGTTTQVLPLTPGSPKGTYGTTSRPFVPAELSTVELSRMTQLCGFVQANGSGLGICKSCRFGGLGADTRD